MLGLVESKSPVRQLSESVIPAVRGEFYRYPAEFNEDRPLYVLMKCKASKSRPLAAAAALGAECNLVFLFDGPVHICSIQRAGSFGLLGKTFESKSFGETWIAPAGITVERFRALSEGRDLTALVDVCRVACSEHKTFIELQPATVYAMMTDTGKYGLFLVKELMSASVEIDACHILL